MKIIPEPEFRRVYTTCVAAALILLAGVTGGLAASIQLQAQRVFEPLGKLKLPAAVVVAPDGSGRQFLVQQAGEILILPADHSS